jgi:hypothetical protein
MSMDFSCDTCVWAPTAISTITAKTNLPFANGAPIVQLSQTVDILDKNGQVVGRLDTPLAPATAVGNTVTTTTPAAPLQVASGSHDIYSAFIGDLNLADTYELGLRGTTSSVLNLGVLGMIEVKGIKLDVKSSIQGLQGLKDVKLMSIAGIGLSNEGTKVTSVVKIHNPSKLTLKLGNMILKAGLNTTAPGYSGKSYMNDMVLAPGDNELGALVVMETGGPATTEIFNALNVGDVKLVLYGFEGSSPNPALAAGLGSLVTGVVLPAFLITPPTVAAYDNQASILVSPDTKDTGLVDITFKINNPFTTLPMTIKELYDPSGAAGTTMYMMSARYTLIPEPLAGPITLKAGESKSVTAKFKLVLGGTTEQLVQAGKSGSVPFGIDLWSPTLHVDGAPDDFQPDWSAYSVHYEPTITLKTGPDFDLLLDYQFPPAPARPAPTTTVATPVETPAPVTTTEPAPVTTAAPEPTQTEAPTTTEAPVVPTPAPTTTEEPPAPEVTA